MAQRVVLHIGTMKSGTTYLQSCLVGGAAELAQGGAFYVGGTFGAQTGAVGGMLGPPAKRERAKWDRLVAEVHERDGVAVFSQEFLSFAKPPLVAELMSSFAGLEVDVLVSVRDQHRAIPAQWQTYVRNLGTSEWPAFVDELQPMVTDEPSDSLALRKFRRAQDVPAVVERWAGHPGTSSVRLLTVPGAGSAPSELWHRFCRAARLEVPVPPGADAAANESLGYASCHVLAHVNRVTTSLPKPDYWRTRTRMVQALLPLRADEGRPVLDRDGAALAAELNRRTLALAGHDRVVVVDGMQELDPTVPEGTPATTPPPDPDHVSRAVDRVWQECFGDRPRPSDDEQATVAVGDHLVAWAREAGE